MANINILEKLKKYNIQIRWMNWNKARSIIVLFCMFAIFACANVSVTDWRYYALGGVVVLYSIVSFEEGYQSAKKIWKGLLDTHADDMDRTTRKAVHLHHELEQEMKLHGFGKPTKSIYEN